MWNVRAPRLIITASSLALAFCLSACGRTSNPDTEIAIAKLSSGSTIRAIEMASREGEGEARASFEPVEPVAEHAAADEGAGSGGPDPVKYFEDLARPIVNLLTTDPCLMVQHPAPGATETEWREALDQLGSCMRSAMHPAEVIRGAILYLYVYSTQLMDMPLSAMQDEQLEKFLQNNYSLPGQLAGLSDADAPRRLKLRDRFEDRELDELGRLNRELRRRLQAAESVMLSMARDHREVFEHYAPKNNRYALLLLLADAVFQKQPAGTQLNQVRDLMRASAMYVPEDLAQFPAEMLHPLAMVSVQPDRGKETDSLHEPAENPFRVIEGAMAQLAGPDWLVKQQRAHYAILRANDNQPMATLHDAPHPQAARVAVLDTGVDYQRFPEIGEFLSDARIPGSMGSYDYQDNDRIPFLPALDPESSHGSGTVASILTVLSHYAPSVLGDRKIDLAVWKTGTIRSQLSAPYYGRTSWDSRAALAEALIDQAVNPAITLKPQIVSISMIFNLKAYLRNSGHPDAVLKAPWLWVMAAGNEGIEVAKDDIPPCLGDVPAKQRIDANILCVGALRKGIVYDTIADYSNFGSRVDVYAYESFTELCPNGTSCSTPGVAGVAAAIQAKYPELTPALIKRAIVDAADVRVLAVGGKHFEVLTAQPKRRVRVLDPGTMMRKALANAHRLDNELRRKKAPEPQNALAKP